MESVLTYKHKKKNQILEIVYDGFDMSNPRKNGDYHLGTILYDWNDYLIGDIHITSKDQFDEYMKVKHFKLPIHVYEHGNITISLGNEYPYNDEWDSGIGGYIYVTYEDIKKHFEVKRVTKKLLKTVKQCFEGEIKEQDYWLRGDCYGFQLYNVKNCDLEHEHKEIEESCYGFIDTSDKMLGYALEYIGGQKSDWIEESK